MSITKSEIEKLNGSEIGALRTRRLPGGGVMASKRKYELVFVGGALAQPPIPRHKRWHAAIAAAETEARRVMRAMDMEPSPVSLDPSHVGLSSRTAAHEPIIYGPGCGQDGRRVLGHGNQEVA